MQTYAITITIVIIIIIIIIIIITSHGLGAHEQRGQLFSLCRNPNGQLRSVQEVGNEGQSSTIRKKKVYIMKKHVKYIYNLEILHNYTPYKHLAFKIVIGFHLISYTDQFISIIKVRYTFITKIISII